MFAFEPRIESLRCVLGQNTWVCKQALISATPPAVELVKLKLAGEACVGSVGIWHEFSCESASYFPLRI